MIGFFPVVLVVYRVTRSLVNRIQCTPDPDNCISQSIVSAWYVCHPERDPTPHAGSDKNIGCRAAASSRDHYCTLS